LGILTVSNCNLKISVTQFPLYSTDRMSLKVHPALSDHTMLQYDMNSSDAMYSGRRINNTVFKL